MAIYTMTGEVLGLATRYIIDTEAKTVTGYIEDLFLRDFILYEVCNQLMSISPIAEIRKCLLIKDNISATVKCTPEDEFDVLVGVKIAKRRLTAKLNRARETALLKYYAYLNKQTLAVERLLKKYPMSERTETAVADYHSMLDHGYGCGYK